MLCWAATPGGPRDKARPWDSSSCWASWGPRLHHGALQHLADLQRLVLQHGRLVGQPHALQVPVRVESCAAAQSARATTLAAACSRALISPGAQLAGACHGCVAAGVQAPRTPTPTHLRMLHDHHPAPWLSVLGPCSTPGTAGQASALRCMSRPWRLAQPISSRASISSCAHETRAACSAAHERAAHLLSWPS